MKSFLAALLLVAGLATASFHSAAADNGGRDPGYTLERFPYPTNIDGVEVGDYTALAHHARLAAGYTPYPEFDTVGVIMTGEGTEVFRVGTPLQDYTWYWGINEQLTTVGFMADFFTPTRAWLRTRNGTVRTFADPAGEADVYLYRVNNQDVAVGEIVYGFGFWRPIRVDRNGLHFDNPPGVPATATAYYAGINNTGAIIGGMTDSDTGVHICLLWDNNTVTAINHAGARFVAPRALNNHGQIAGWWEESAIDPALDTYRRHGFIRDRNGQFRTVDIHYAWQEELEIMDGVIVTLVGQTTEILDMNDRGELLVQLTGYYDWDGFIFPTWFYALANPRR